MLKPTDMYCVAVMIQRARVNIPSVFLYQLCSRNIILAEQGLEFFGRGDRDPKPDPFIIFIDLNLSGKILLEFKRI